MKKVHIRLKELRLSRGLKQYQMADMLNIHRSTYTKYETARSYPPLDIFRDLCVSLNVSADWLLGLTEEEPIVCDELSSFL